MIHGVVFDMDGLMFDTERLGAESWESAARELGISLPEGMYNRFIGLDRREAERLFSEYFEGEADFKVVSACAGKYFSEGLSGGVPVKPGLFELLEHIRRTGRRAALATSTYSEKAREYLRRAGAEEYFDVFVCGEMVARGKPMPDIYIMAAALLELPPGECMALEDSPAGIRSASAAGLRTVMIPDRVAPDDELRGLLFDIKGSLSEVIELLWAADSFRERP